jgi:hypothetical protein
MQGKAHEHMCSFSCAGGLIAAHSWETESLHKPLKKNYDVQSMMQVATEMMDCVNF